MTKSEWITEAVKTIVRGTELMPLHRLSQWDGVLDLLESTDRIEGDRCPTCDLRTRLVKTAREVIAERDGKAGA